MKETFDFGPATPTAAPVAAKGDSPGLGPLLALAAGVACLFLFGAVASSGSDKRLPEAMKDLSSYVKATGDVPLARACDKDGCEFAAGRFAVVSRPDGGKVLVRDADGTPHVLAAFDAGPFGGSYASRLISGPWDDELAREVSALAARVRAAGAKTPAEAADARWQAEKAAVARILSKP